MYIEVIVCYIIVVFLRHGVHPLAWCDKLAVQLNRQL